MAQFNVELGHHNKSEMRPNKPFQDFYNDDTRSVVEAIYAGDLDMLKYSFDEED